MTDTIAALTLGAPRDIETRFGGFAGPGRDVTFGARRVTFGARRNGDATKRGRDENVASGDGLRRSAPTGPPSLGSIADVLLKDRISYRFALAVGAVIAVSAVLAAPSATAQDDAGNAVVVAEDDDSRPADESGSPEEGGAGEVHDEEHVDEEHGDAPPLLSFDIGSAFWNLLIFLAVLAVLGKFVWPNVLGGLKSREEKIRGDLESAEKANAKATSLLAEYQKKLDDASTQVQSMLAEARRDAEASGQRIVDEAKQEADRQRERALSDIETAKQVAVSEIADQASGLAMRVARSVVGRELNPNDHADLIRQSLDRLPKHQ